MWICQANEVPGFEGSRAVLRCTRCNEWLRNKVRMLELDQRDGSYHDRGDVPEDKSQGWFPFGIACAKREVR